jgi:hypothetical protein
MTFEVIENTEDRTSETVIRRKIYRTHSIRAGTDTRFTTAFSMTTSFSDTTTRTELRDATNATRPMGSKRSSSPE